MEMIKRKIKLFFVIYGKLFAFVIFAIFILIFIIQTLNSMVIEENESKYSNEEYLNRIETIEKQEEDKQVILNFINYCNEGKIELAYAMLSEACKIDKYKTIEEFKEKYIDQVFNINICNNNIKEKDNIYMVTLIQDMLLTGKTDSILETSYKIEGVLERKIYVIN